MSTRPAWPRGPSGGEYWFDGHPTAGLNERGIEAVSVNEDVTLEDIGGDGEFVRPLRELRKEIRDAHPGVVRGIAGHEALDLRRLEILPEAGQ